MCLKFGDVVHMYNDPQDTQSSLLDLRNIFSVLDNGLGHLGIARRRPSKGLFTKRKKTNEATTLLLEAATALSDQDGTRTRNLCHSPSTGKQRLAIRPPDPKV